ncbi:MAG: YesL family protein, partial [Lachnospiraceae bacterium]|nr:YesL family protein [Lachnospiraceae bacterium]
MIKLCMGCYLNMLWFVCSIPIFTVGASTAALYYSTLKIVREEEGQSVTALFFKAFKD